VQSLLDVLAPDVVIVADGGGVVAAARHPIVGVERVSAFLMSAARLPDFAAKPVWINGSPGARIDIRGEADTAVSMTVENGRITHIYAVRNPHKLAGLDVVAALTRS
jgi:RNA polymerase sigma-70 factor, ECF subfamily